jgi:uncharacterized protein with NAD-binding domain and iron-sulfur cluster
MPVKKIAVLGGGLASIAAVFKLTQQPDWKSFYDITVYQIGWRLGGKCASGRNAAVSQRIEEHGLHLWFGFYDNAFDMIQHCYRENNQDWEKAFAGYDSVCLEEETPNGWEHWLFTMKPNAKTPGYDNSHPTKSDYIYQILIWLKSLHEEYDIQNDPALYENIIKHASGRHMLGVLPLLNDSVIGTDKNDLDVGSRIFSEAITSYEMSNFSLMNVLLMKYMEWLEWIAKDLLESNAKLRRLFIMADLAITIITGMIDDNVLTGGFKVINRYDFREWLIKHGAQKITVRSAIVQGVYGLVFGGKDQYTFEAGTALRGILRLFLTYKGHVYYRMLDGMADIVFTPLYNVLKTRGVKFEFFSKVSKISLTTDKINVNKVELDIQAVLKSNLNSYNPLIKVNGTFCWPSVPNYDQLQNEELLKTHDLESYYSTLQPFAKKTLQWNTDFDLVILGISIGAFPAIASELIEYNSRWQKMIKDVVPVPTIAFQLWLKCSIADMQWEFQNAGLALLGSYREPYDTWADMSHLIYKEQWPAGHVPKNIAYFCGPTPNPDAVQIMVNAQSANFSDAAFPELQNQVAYTNALEFLRNLTQHIWPGISITPGSFDFTQLTDLTNGGGEDRLKNQFFRANIDPTELYVMSFTNSSSSRLKTDQNGYHNLYITGDWIDNGFNAGCVEATVMAGLQTARSVSGQHFEIPGENDF